MTHHARAALCAFVATLSLAMPAVAAPADDYSARLDALWDFNAPAASEARFRKALAAADASTDGGGVVQIRIAKWTVARGLRSLERLDEAEAIQLALAKETEAANRRDGYVYEELAEIALARNDASAAKPWAAKAYSLLKDDGALKSGEPARLARLAKVGGVGPSP